MKKKIVALMLVISLMGGVFIGCGTREVNRVSKNVSLEADNFNVIRRLVVINARTDKPMFELIGAFSFTLEDNRIVATVETGKKRIQETFRGSDRLDIVVCRRLKWGKC